MLRSLMVGLVLMLAVWNVAGAQTVLWPDQFGQFTKKSSKPVDLKDVAIWEEYGFQQGETAQYASPADRFAATAWRLKDPTGAMAAFQWQRPRDAKPSRLGTLAAETTDGVLVAYGNYLFRFVGYKPHVSELEALFNILPRLDQSSLPTLRGYLPAAGLIANSERYVLGPASLAKFAPGIPPSVAAFHVGAEAQLANYRSGSGEMRLAIFSYPTPQIARQQAEAFGKVAGAVVKRAGPLVAAVLSPPDPDAAEVLLAGIRYEPTITLSQYVPTRRDLWTDLLINIFILIGILLVFCTVAGLAVGGFRALGRGRGAGDDMIVLHLEER